MRIDRFVLHHGDCLDVLREMPENSVDAIVTDPPYGLSFMGKQWDYDVPSEDVWRECLRVLKPGGHLLAFAGTRTQHRMAIRIEDAGFEIRDMIAWVYGSGFPKSLDVSKAIDKAEGAERKVGDVAGKSKIGGGNIATTGMTGGEYYRTTPATPAARQWDGWGTALKPSLEPLTLARKPLSGTVAANVLTHGTGALNVDGCRVPREGEQDGWPANFIHDGSNEVVGLFPVTKSGKPCGTRQAPHHWKSEERGTQLTGFGDSGSAARFFYCAKASKRDRDEGCEGMPLVMAMRYGEKAQGPLPQQTPSKPVAQRNHHPTVKPTALMRYLCRLVTPPGGVVLDPFTGSGSTGKAAMLEGFHFVGIEREAEYLAIAQARIEHAIERAIARDNAPMRNSDDHQKKLFAEIS